MTTPAEQEAERRYPQTARMRFAFESGAAFEREQLRELLEAAREYRGNPSAQLEADELGLVGPATCAEDEIIGRLLAAAAALPGETA